MRACFLRALAALLYISFGIEPSVAASPEQTYMRDCAVCHLPGIAAVRQHSMRR